MIVDSTPNPRRYSKTLEDKTVVYTANPGPGNRPIAYGHIYSIVAILPQDRQDKSHWLIPVSARRIRSDQKSNEVGISQALDFKKWCVPEQQMIIIADSLYGTENCRQQIQKDKNIILICRMNLSRNVFFAATKVEKLGRTKIYGHKMTLKNKESHQPPSQVVYLTRTSARGIEFNVRLTVWDKVLVRGSRKFSAARDPFTLIQVENYHNKNDKSGRPIFISIFGTLRHTITPENIFDNYCKRFDIEHLFRFQKTKLMLTSYQTCITAHEEAWWKLSIATVAQLYLARNLIMATPQRWERHLLVYKKNTNVGNCLPPAAVQVGFSTLRDEIGSPAQPCKSRGIPPGRAAGELKKRAYSPVIIKSKFACIKMTPLQMLDKTLKIIYTGSEKLAHCSDLQIKILQLKKSARQSLGSHALSFDDMMELVLPIMLQKISLPLIE